MIESLKEHIKKLDQEEKKVVWMLHKFETREYDGCHQNEDRGHWHYYTPEEAVKSEHLSKMVPVLKPISWVRKNIN